MPGISGVGVFTAFLAGLISFLSPCVLPLVPGYISYIAGRPVASGSTVADIALRLPAIGLSICFVLGFSTIFILLGTGATALGQVLLSYRYELNIVGGIIVAVFGLFIIGLMRPSWVLRDIRFHAVIPGGRPFSAYILGVAFAFGWTPCIGPILGAILTVSASSATVADGVALLAAYSLGLGVPFLMAAVFTDELVVRLRSLRRLGRILQPIAGGTMILMGVAMISGQLSVLSYWLLNTFPALGNIG